MNRWIVTVVIMLGCSFSCWSQRSYCITLAGDTLKGTIYVEDNVIFIKDKKNKTELLVDEVVGYLDKRGNPFIYSKPVRYFESVTVYGFLKREVTGNISLYSRVIKSTDPYAISFDNVPGRPNSYFQGSRKTEVTEYYLESDKAKIQLASRDVIYDFVRGDDQSTERVNDPKFKIEKHLKELITEYNGRH